MMHAILPGVLFQSGTLAALGQEAYDRIEAVIDCTEGPDWTRKNTLLLRFPFDDANYLPDLGGLRTVVAFGAAQIRAGRRVLTHCLEGVNRSGLVNALILLDLKVVKTGKDAVAMIRYRRPGSLSNARFVDFLEQGK